MIQALVQWLKRLLPWSWRPPVWVIDKPSGSNGQNRVAWVVIYGNATSTARTLAHEVAQLSRRWLWVTWPGLAIAAAIGVAVGLHVGMVEGIAAGIIPGIAALVAFRFPPIQRELEYYARECETQAAALVYGDDEETYRIAEANALKAGTRYNGAYRSIAVGTIYDRMLKNRPAARRWVLANLPLLIAFKTRFR